MFNLLQTSLGGFYINDFNLYGRTWQVNLQAESVDRADRSALDRLNIRTKAGEMVPLSAIATVSTRSAPLALVHQSQFPAVTLSFNLQPGSSLGAAVEAIQRAQREIEMPEAIVATFSGTAAEFRSSLKSEPWLLLARTR